MKREKPTHVQHSETNAHLHVLKSLRRENLVSVTFFIPKNNVKVSAVALYLDLIKFCSKAYLSYAGLKKKLDSLYGAKLSINEEIYDRDIAVTFSISVSDDKYIHTIKNLLMDAIEVLHALVDQGISRDENIFESVKKHAISVTNNFLNTDESILNGAVRKIIHEKVTYNELHYGTEESINAVTFTDLLVVLEEMKLSPRIVTFIGNETAQAALKIKNYFKPSPYFPRLRSNDIEISKPLEIKEATLKEKTGLVAYRYKGCSSEHQFLISLMYPNIIEELLYKTYRFQYQLKVNINQLNGLVVISSSGSELVSEVFINNLKTILSSEYSNLDSKFIEKEKKQLKRKLVMIKEEPHMHASFIKQVTILGLPTDIDVYIDKLDTLKIEDIKSYLVHSTLVGTMNGAK